MEKGFGRYLIKAGFWSVEFHGFQLGLSALRDISRFTGFQVETSA
jgi:hypothetical protein